MLHASTHARSTQLQTLFTLMLCMCMTPIAMALTYSVPTIGNRIGQSEEIPAKAGDTLSSIAERFSIGHQAMINANPKLQHQKLRAGTLVKIPSQFYLPRSVPRQGLVINLREMRAYYYHPETKLVSTYPLCVGRTGWETPQGMTSVVSKTANPAWHPTVSIKAEAEAHGHPLPDTVPAGPHNPLGRYAIHLGINGILIHGTNSPSSVGQRSSHGCMRLYAADIEELFKHISLGEVVHLIDETPS